MIIKSVINWTYLRITKWNQKKSSYEMNKEMLKNIRKKSL